MADERHVAYCKRKGFQADGPCIYCNGHGDDGGGRNCVYCRGDGSSQTTGVLVDDDAEFCADCWKQLPPQCGGSCPECFDQAAADREVHEDQRMDDERWERDHEI